MIEMLAERRVVIFLILVLAGSLFASVPTDTVPWPSWLEDDATAGIGIDMTLTNALENTSRYGTYMTLAANMGAKFVRVSNEWDGTVGSFTFGDLRWIVDAAAARGMAVMILVNYDNVPPITAQQKSDYTAFCVALVTEFQNDNVYFEMWNEPNAEEFWHLPNANDYMAAMSMSMAAMRAVDPDCIIIAPNSSGIDNALSFIETCFQQGLLNYTDIVSAHPYHTHGDTPEINLTTPRYPSLRNLVNTYSTPETVSIGSSELGINQSWWNNTSLFRTQDQQARDLARSVLVDMILRHPIRSIFKYNDWHDPGTASFMGFGVMDKTLVTSKQSYYAMQTLLVDQLNETRFLEMVRPTPNDSDYYIALFNGQSKAVIVAWIGGSFNPVSTTVEFEVPGAPIEMVDKYGTAMTTPTMVDGKITIQISDHPVYIKFASTETCPEGDITGDCFVDYNDLEIMAQDWLEGDYTTGTGDANLILHYTFDVDPITDSSASLRHGAKQGGGAGDLVVINSPGPDGSAGYVEFHGPTHPGPGWVQLPEDPTAAGLTEFTVTMWVNAMGVLGGNADPKALFTTPTMVHINMRALPGDQMDIFTAYGGMLYSTSMPKVTTGWFHAALVCTPTLVQFYIDGQPDTSAIPSSPPPAADFEEVLYIGSWSTGRQYDGLMDDLRIYDYALSDSEIDYLVNNGTVYNPWTSLANLSDDEPIGSKIVNFKDFAILAEDWLVE